MNSAELSDILVGNSSFIVVDECGSESNNDEYKLIEDAGPSVNSSSEEEEGELNDPEETETDNITVSKDLIILPHSPENDIKRVDADAIFVNLESKKQEQQQNTETSADDDNIPLMNIIFRSNEIFDQFRKPFLECINLMLTKMDNAKFNVLENKLDNSILVLNKNSKTQLRHDDIFMFDTTLSEVQCRKSIPSYKAYLTPKAAPKTDDKAKFKNKSSCFNCEGDHNLMECKEPRNQRKINKAKNEHFRKGQRYHIDLEQKYGKFVPGHISSTLRKALGLSKYDLPCHVIKMKQFGYPPGWLEDAKISHSGLNLFDSKGKKVLESDDDDGEIDIVKDKYDARKIFEYPGYNVPVENLDRNYDRSDILPHQSKDAFIQSLQGNLVQGYKRRKLKKLSADTDEPPEKDINLEPTDMITENDSEEPIIAQFNSPVREQIEAEVIEIKDSPVCARFDTVANPNEDAVLLSDSDDSNVMDQQPSTPKPDIISEENTSSSSIPSTPKSFKQINTTDLGTPVIKAFSPYSTLPSGIEFSKGVSDVIHFENLPDSTGNYEKKIKSLICKVRSHITKMNSE